MEEDKKKSPPKMPLFKKASIPKVKAQKISYLQESFEKFWIHVQSVVPATEEKELGKRRLQEACVWFSRAIATRAFDNVQKKLLVEQSDEPIKAPILTPEKIAKNERVDKAAIEREKAKEFDKEENKGNLKPSTTIITKKRKSSLIK